MKRAEDYMIPNDDPVCWRLIRALVTRKQERALSTPLYNFEQVFELKPSKETSNKKGKKDKKDKKEKPQKRSALEMCGLYLAPAEIQRIKRRIKPKTITTSTPGVTAEDKKFYYMLGAHSMGCLPHEVQGKNQIYLKRNNDKSSTAYQIKNYADIGNAKNPKQFFKTVHSDKKVIARAVMYYTYATQNLKPEMSEEQTKIHNASEKATRISRNRKMNAADESIADDCTADDSTADDSTADDSTADVSTDGEDNAVEDNEAEGNAVEENGMENIADEESNNGEELVIDDGGDDVEMNSNDDQIGNDLPIPPAENPAVTPEPVKQPVKPRRLYEDPIVNSQSNNKPKVNVFKNITSSKRKKHGKGSKKSKKIIISETDDEGQNVGNLDDTVPMQDDEQPPNFPPLQRQKEFSGRNNSITGTYLLNINYYL